MPPKIIEQFTLDLRRDVHSRRAAAAYADSVEYDKPDVAAALRRAVEAFGGTGAGGRDGIGAAVRGS